LFELEILMSKRLTLAASFAAALLVGAGGAASASPILEATASFGGSAYDFYSVSGGITWTDANSYALGLGGGAHLAILDTSPENSFVAAAIPTTLIHSPLGPWIGATKASSTDVFKWVNGAVFAAFENGNFEPGQPDGAEGYPTAVLFYPTNTGKWGDYGAQCGAGACANVLDPVSGFIVEREVPEPSTIALIALAFLSLFGLGYLRRAQG